MDRSCGYIIKTSLTKRRKKERHEDMIYLVSIAISITKMATRVVSHGRRKGSLKTTPEAVTREQSPLRSGQVAVLSGAEWYRICNSVQGKKQPQNDREDLHEKSKSVVKNWENTIEVSRQLLQ